MTNSIQDTPAKPGKTAKQRVVWLISFVIAFLVVKEVKQWYFDNRALENAGVAASQAMDDLRTKVAAEHPEKPVVYALQEEAVKQSAENLAKKSGDQKSDAAAGQFIGYYMINVRTRHEYCKGLGVDISPYTNAFVQENKDLYAKSRTIHARGPYTPDKVENEMYRQLMPSMQKTISEAMTAMAKQNNMTEKDVCAAFNANGVTLASEMQLSKISPALYQAMIEAK